MVKVPLTFKAPIDVSVHIDEKNIIFTVRDDALGQIRTSACMSKPLYSTFSGPADLGRDNSLVGENDIKSF